MWSTPGATSTVRWAIPSATGGGLDVQAANLLPANDLAASIVGAGTPANVETVLVGGVVRKHLGRLVGVDVDALRAQAEASRDRLFAIPAAEA